MLLTQGCLVLLEWTFLAQSTPRLFQKCPCPWQGGWNQMITFRPFCDAAAEVTHALKRSKNHPVILRGRKAEIQGFLICQKRRTAKLLSTQEMLPSAA